MASYLNTTLREEQLDRYPEYPPKADLRKLMSQYALPTIATGTIDLNSMGSDEPTKQALAVLKTFNAALVADDSETLKSCFFAEQSFWKDELALTYHLRTFTSPDAVTASLLETKNLRGLSGGFEIAGEAQSVPATPVLQFIDCGLAFRTSLPAATCSGRMLLLPVKDEKQTGNHEPVAWKIWILSTRLENLDIHPEDESLLNSPGRQSDDLPTLETDVFIVGGGNAAVALAARLKAMSVDSIMVDRNAHVGDNWALRYDCMKFHLPTAFCDLPYMSYSKEQQSPYLLTKDDLAEQVRRFVAAFNLNVINSAEIINTTQIQDKRWQIEFRTPTGRRTVIAKQIVQATGFGSQKPYLPPIADQELYNGVSVHSAQYKNPMELKSQSVSSVLVIGSANTAFDVLEDCQAAGLHVTMIARSPTYIMTLEHVCDKRGLGAYDSGVEATDRFVLTLPTIVDSQFGKGLFTHLASLEPDRYSALAGTGFQVYDSRHPDAALMHNLIERGGGHYVDTGATALLVEGKAGFKCGAEPVAYTSTGLRLSDGTTVDADAVIWCTGFADKDARETAADIFKTPLHVDATWGVDKEGEIRGMWKRHLHVDNYWVMGGYTQQHRWYSRALALQIKAALEGILPPAYRDTPPLAAA
ncbi:hypothetical protein MBLNU459_g8301t1 [Dothideomycetes sp. NU459]